MKKNISKFILTNSIIVLSSFLCKAQIVSGIIFDQGNNPVEYANVVLYSLEQDAPIDYSISDSTGFYIIEDISEGSYKIEISMIGFSDYKSDTIFISNHRAKINLDCILQYGIDLDEISIVSKRPKIIERADKTIVNLENSVNVGANLLGVLKKVPGVIVSRNLISAKGQPISKILVNGKSTNHLDIESVMNSLNGDNIAKIEVIYQADSSYEASGSGVIINVILKKNKLKGLNGSVGSMIAKTNPLDYSESLSLSYLKNKANFLFSHSYSNSNWQETNTTNRKILNTNYFQQSINDYKPQELTLNLDFDYFLNSKNSIGAQVGYNKSSNKWSGRSTVEFLDSIKTGKSISDQTTSESLNFYNINPYYEYKWNNKSTEYFRVDFRYIRYQSNDDISFNLIEQEQLEILQPNNRQNGESDIYSFQLDYAKEMNPSLLLESGIKYDQTYLNSLFVNVANGLRQDFTINEDILGVYTQIKYNKEKLNTRIGLRWEYSITEGKSKSNEKGTNLKINQLFPSISISYPIHEKVQTSFSYSYRINRPGYNSLNPFQQYYDPLLSDSGNANLKSEFVHSLRANFILFDKISLSTTYKKTLDDVFEFVEQDNNTKSLNRQLINIDKSEFFVMTCGLQYSLLDIEASSNFTVRHQSYESSIELFKNTGAKWSYIFNQDLSLSLPFDLNIEGGFSFASGRLNGLMETDWYAFAYSSISGEYWNDRIQFSLEFEDLVSRGFRHSIEYKNIDARIMNQWNNYNIFLRIKYKFGSRFLKESNRKRQSSGIERLY